MRDAALGGPVSWELLHRARHCFQRWPPCSMGAWAQAGMEATWQQAVCPPHPLPGPHLKAVVADEAKAPAVARVRVPHDLGRVDNDAKRAERVVQQLQGRGAREAVRACSGGGRVGRAGWLAVFGRCVLLDMCV